MRKYFISFICICTLICAFSLGQVYAQEPDSGGIPSETGGSDWTSACDSCASDIGNSIPSSPPSIGETLANPNPSNNDSRDTLPGTDKQAGGSTGTDRHASGNQSQIGPGCPGCNQVPLDERGLPQPPRVGETPIFCLPGGLCLFKAPQSPIPQPQQTNQQPCFLNCQSQQPQQQQPQQQNPNQVSTPTPTRAQSNNNSGNAGNLQTIVGRSCPVASAPVINILFVGQGFSSNDAFTAAVKAKTDLFFQTPPYNTYKAAFQVTGVNSTQNFGCLDSLQPDAVRRAQQLAQQGQQDPLQAQCVNGVLGVAQQYPHDVVISLSNGKGYNSYANFPPTSFVISMTDFGDVSGKNHPGLNADNIFLHEMGHALGDLADEYSIPGMTSPPYPKKDNCAANANEVNAWKSWSEVQDVIAELGKSGKSLGVSPCVLGTWSRPSNGGSMMDTDNYMWTNNPHKYGGVETHIIKRTLDKYAACLTNAGSSTATPTITPRTGSGGVNVPPTSQFTNGTSTPTPGGAKPINIKTFTIEELTPHP